MTEELKFYMDCFKFINMSQQPEIKEPKLGSLNPEIKEQPSQISHSNLLLTQLYEKLSNQTKITKLNFISSNNKSLPKKEKSQDHRADPEKSSKEALSSEKSHFNTKSVFLPALKHKTKHNQYRQKLIINDAIFIHQRVPILDTTKSLIGQDPANKKSGSNHQYDTLNSDNRRRSNPTKTKISQATPSLKLLGDIEVIEMSATEVIKLDKIQSPKRKKLNRHRSIQKLVKMNSEAAYPYPVDENVKSIKVKPETITIDPCDPELYKKKSKIQKMIMYYRLKKLKAEEKAYSQKNIISQALEDMDKMNVRGQHPTIYYAKKESPTRKESLAKKYQTITRERSFTELAKIKYSTWKNRQFPFNDLLKAEANKLFAYYLGIKEVIPASGGNYRVYVGEGNNSQLVLRLLKNRGWWVPTEDINEAHLVWTQHPQEDIMRKAQQWEGIKLKTSSSLSFNIPSNEVHALEAESLRKFLKHKSNNFFQAINKLLHPILYHKIMGQICQRFKQNKYIRNYMSLKETISRNMSIQPILALQSKNTTIFNHCEYSDEIGDKKNLWFHVLKYCQLNQIDRDRLIPTTVHINQTDIEAIKRADNSQALIASKLDIFQEDALYILKPGESSNRGNGITIHQTKSAMVQHISKSLQTFPQSKTYIAQRYIDPLLYQGRKFDIRVWVLYANNRLWFYRQGYVRTSCKEYNTKNMNKYIHLTNDAVQKYADEYGKYQPANKVSFQEMDKYLKRAYRYDGFYTQAYMKIKYLTKILFEAGMLVMGRTSHQFQLFGLDFLLDRQFNVWLIQCNSNPSIEVCCSLLARLVPNMLQNVITIAIDPFFPPPERKLVREEPQWLCDRFNFELLSDCTIQTSYLNKVIQDKQYLSYLSKINPDRLAEIYHKLNTENKSQNE